MSSLCSVLLTPDPTSTAPTSAGLEVSNSRRTIYVPDVQWARCSYAGGGIGACQVGVSYSLDGGATWATFIPPGPTLGASGTVLAGDWTDVSALVGGGDITVSAWAYGGSLLGGLSYSLQFVELQLR